MEAGFCVVLLDSGIPHPALVLDLKRLANERLSFYRCLGAHILSESTLFLLRTSTLHSMHLQIFHSKLIEKWGGGGGARF
jgi:hypothetical protein